MSLITPVDLYILRTARDLGAEGDATVDRLRGSLDHVVPDADVHINRLLSAGHLRIVGGHLDLHAAALQALDTELELHGFERPSTRR